MMSTAVFPVMVATFIGYLLGVRLLEVVIARLRSITFIKVVHTVAFVLLSALLAMFLYEVVVDKPTYLTWLAVALFLAEGVLLVANHGRCPLTLYAEALGSAHGQITDTFLPKWFADRVFPIYGVSFALALAVVAVRAIR